MYKDCFLPSINFVLLWLAMNNEIHWFLLGSHNKGREKTIIGRVYNLGDRDRTTEFRLRDESSTNIIATDNCFWN